MAALAANSYAHQQIGPGPYGEDEHLHAVTEIVYRGSIISVDTSGTGAGVRKAAATNTGNPLGIAMVGGSAVAATTKTKVFTKGRFRVTMANAVNREDALFKEFFFDVSLGSDNLADLLSDAAAGTGDIAFARCVKWHSATDIELEIGYVEPRVHA